MAALSGLGAAAVLGAPAMQRDRDEFGSAVGDLSKNSSSIENVNNSVELANVDLAAAKEPVMINSWLKFNPGTFSDSFYISRSMSRKIHSWYEDFEGSNWEKAQEGADKLKESAIGFYLCKGIDRLGNKVSIGCGVVAAYLARSQFQFLKEAAEDATERNSCIKVRVWGDIERRPPRIAALDIDATSPTNEFCFD